MPREVLYARKTALGVRIVAPSTAIDILALKLYVGNKRAKNRIAGLLSIIEEMQFVESRINKTPIKTSEKERFQEFMWVDNIVVILNE